MNEVFTDWLRFQNYAKSHGFDSLEFMAVFPCGARKCRWLDAYYGFFTIDGIEGFVTVRDADEIFPNATCIPLHPETETDRELELEGICCLPDDLVGPIHNFAALDAEAAEGDSDAVEHSD